MQRVNDPDAAARRDAGNGLGELQVRVHPCGGIEEKHTQQSGAIGGVSVLAGDPVSGTQCGDGVAEVATIGGFERQVEVSLDPARMRAHGVSYAQVAEAVTAANVLAVFEARGLAVSDELRARVLACTDLDQLGLWLRRAVTVAAPGDIFVAG